MWSCYPIQRVSQYLTRSKLASPSCLSYFDAVHRVPASHTVPSGMCIDQSFVTVLVLVQSLISQWLFWRLSSQSSSNWSMLNCFSSIFNQMFSSLVYTWKRVFSGCRTVIKQKRCWRSSSISTVILSSMLSYKPLEPFSEKRYDTEVDRNNGEGVPLHLMSFVLISWVSIHFLPHGYAVNVVWKNDVFELHNGARSICWRKNSVHWTQKDC